MDKENLNEQLDANNVATEEYAEEILETDEYGEEEVITLFSEDGEEIEFVEVASIELEDKCYSILQPVELLEGMEEDEALVFEIVESEEGEKFQLIDDDAIIDAVFEEYNKLLEEVDEEEQ